MSAQRTSLRTTLFAGVSVIALVAASAQLAEAAPPPPVVATGPIVTMFVEGGLMSTGGGTIITLTSVAVSRPFDPWFLN